MHPTQYTSPLLLVATVFALTACGGGGGGGGGSTSGGGSGAGATMVASRLASDVALPSSLSGGFAEGISADPATGDLYVGTDGTSGSSPVSLILKAGAQANSFTDWLPVSILGGATSALVTGTRVYNNKLYACINRPSSSAQIWAIKLSDKSVPDKFSLPSTETFCNDMAFDASGNLLATTNAGGPFGAGTESVYKLPAATVQTGGTVAGTTWIKWSTGGGAVNGLLYDANKGKLFWAQGNSVVSSATGTASAIPVAELIGLRFDGLQLTSAGNLMGVLADGTKTYVFNLSTNIGTELPGGAECASTVAIVGDDAFCPTASTQKVLRLVGAGKL